MRRMKTLAMSANGEGFGHVARMVTMVPALSREYRLILYAPAHTHAFLRQNLRDVASGAIPLRDIPCLTFVKRGERIDYRETVRNALPILLRGRTLIRRLRDSLAADGADALLSDFEPFCAWAATALGIPVLQLNHPGIIARSASVFPDALASKLVASLMMARWDSRILVSFYDGDVGPMIRPEIRAARRDNDGSVVVYLKPGYRKHIERAFDKLGVENYHLFPDPSKDYVSCLARCKAVISGAGHQTISEALYLGKPIFAIPQPGQYEQRLNAFMAEAGGFGTSGKMHGLARTLELFLRDVDAGAFPKTSRLPWTTFRSDDDSAAAIDRVCDFMRRRSRPRILPFRAQVLDGWLGSAMADLDDTGASVAE
jgi:UDP:flavonoid glycosyltransferase YjiC (YdhE family)